MKTVLLFTCFLFTTMTRAQLIKVEPGTDMTILGGTVFKVDSFMLTPSSDFVITNNALFKSTTLIHTSVNPHAAKVYQFATNTNPFSGSMQIEYADGELSGIPEESLALNVHNGSTWIFYPIAIRDGSNNFILTDGLNAVSLNEITLASLSNPLPLVWLSFTATKQNQTALLQWATAQERNTKNFTVQHSSNGINWTGIGTLPAAGNSININQYSYVHANPVTGINYYRIIQTDIDNRSNYSELKVLKFTTANEVFTVIGNPASKILTVQVNMASTLALYTTDGKLLWQEQVNAGTKYIDVSRFAQGTYLLKANSTTQKVIIQ